MVVCKQAIREPNETLSDEIYIDIDQDSSYIMKSIIILSIYWKWEWIW